MFPFHGVVQGWLVGTVVIVWLIAHNSSYVTLNDVDKINRFQAKTRQISTCWHYLRDALYLCNVRTKFLRLLSKDREPFLQPITPITRPMAMPFAPNWIIRSDRPTSRYPWMNSDGAWISGLWPMSLNNQRTSFTNNSQYTCVPDCL